MTGVLAIDQRAIDDYANHPGGEVARALDFETANTVFWIVKDALDQPATFTRGANGWFHWQENQAPGPPLSRTGRLWASVAHTRPEVDEKGIHCDITVQSTPRSRADDRGNVVFDDYDYVTKLINDGYVFVHSNDKRFEILERAPGQ